MILLAAIMIQAQAPALAEASVPDAVDQEILVVARKAFRFRYEVRKSGRNGTTDCRIKRSSGDRILDARLCDAALICIPAQALKPDLDAIRACLEPAQKQVIATRAAERVAQAKVR